MDLLELVRQELMQDGHVCAEIKATETLYKAFGILDPCNDYTLATITSYESSTLHTVSATSLTVTIWWVGLIRAFGYRKVSDVTDPRFVPHVHEIAIDLVDPNSIPKLLELLKPLVG